MLDNDFIKLQKKDVDMKELERVARVGGICGIAGILVYLSVVFLRGINAKTTEEFLTLAGTGRNGNFIMLEHFLGAGFGILGIITICALHRLLSSEKSSIASSVAVIFGYVGFGIVVTMLIVQGAVMARMSARFVAASASEQQMVVTLYRGLRSIDLGLDLAWDVFGCISFLLFGMLMIRSRHFGLIFGLSGIIVAGLLLIFNVATAPTPPGNAGLIDLGPLAGLWFLAISIQMLRSAKSVGRYPDLASQAVKA